MSVSIEGVEISEETGEALVSVEADGVAIVAVVPQDLETDDVDAGLEEISRALREHVPRMGGSR